MKKQLFHLFAAMVLLTLFSNTATADQVFIANLTGAQEVPSNASNGKGVCTVFLNAAETHINVNLSYSGLGSAANMGHIHGPAPVGVNTGIQINFAGISGTSATITITNQPITPTQVQQIRSGLAYVNIHTINFSGGEIRGQLKVADKLGDFDGDGRFDVGVYRPSTATFYILNSLNNSVTAQQWGFGNERMEVGDYDGDGRTDFLVIRDEGGVYNWYILQSATNTLRAVAWGAGGAFDRTLKGDYDGDGTTDIAVWRNSTGTFYVLLSSNGQLLARQWGVDGDRRSNGDYDGDGKTDFAVIRNEGGNHVWYILRSSDNLPVAIQWGLSTDETVSRDTSPDFDLDGKTDIAVWRPSNGTFYVRQSSNGALLAMQFGQLGDFPGLVDFDGDGKADFFVVRDVGGSLVWYIWQSSNSTLRSVQWGVTADLPV